MHGQDAAGITAAGDDAELGARLGQRVLVDVSLFGGFLDGAHLLGAASKLLAEEPLRPLPAFGRRLRGFTRLARRLACLGGEVAAGVDG